MTMYNKQHVSTTTPPEITHAHMHTQWSANFLLH